MRQYKIELRTRNHTTLSRPTIIEHVAACVPEGHSVDLTNPQVFILVEVFKVGLTTTYRRDTLTKELHESECLWYLHHGRVLLVV